MSEAAAIVPRSTRIPSIAWLLLLLVTLLILIVAPLGAMLVNAFMDRDRNLTAANFATVLQDSIYWEALANTIVVAGGAALVATSLGTLLGWVFARTNAPAGALLERICEVPIFIPPFVGAVAWALIAAPRTGLFNRGLQLSGLPVEANVYSLAGGYYFMRRIVDPVRAERRTRIAFERLLADARAPT